ncbi:MAG: TlyA family RNA methyltransferase [Acidobacteriota bacterium]|nr:TlyA family RNA methyltransferase [Acidobacteriota bacterium]MDH3528215.1 TlyA family RNA methyltransferase [Acidobacteriota bacterium]
MSDKRVRIDKRLQELGLAPSRSKAQAFIMAGIVLVNDTRVEKPSELVREADSVRLKKKGDAGKYVGRGGIKLEKAMEEFDICSDGYVCLDIGASTGGFTDCLLQMGASKVYAVDVGTNQLAWKLRNDPRVVSMEQVNARHLEADDFPSRFDLITMDVSFISITKIIGALVPLLKDTGTIVTLIKPQFEVGKGEVGKGGIVKDAAKHEAVVQRCVAFAEDQGLKTIGVIESPIRGATGNKEFLAGFRN